MGRPTSEMSREIETSFVLESEQVKTEFEVQSFRQACTTVFTEAVVPTVLAINVNLYSRFMDKAFVNLSNVVSSNSDELIDFFSKSYDGIDKMEAQITIPVQNTGEIEAFRPQYLMELSSDYAQNIKKILSGQYKTESDLKDYVDGKYENKIKRQLVKTSLPVNAEKEQLLSNDNPALVPVTSMYLRGVVNPFLRMAQQSVKEIGDDMAKIKQYIDRSYQDMLTINKVINDMKAQGKIEGKTLVLLNYYSINANRIYMNVLSYVTYLTIRKMNIVSFNMVSYFNLHNTLLNYYPEGQRVIHESAFDGRIDDVEDGDLVFSILQGDTSILISFAQSSIAQKKEAITNITGKILGVNVYSTIDQRAQEYPYDEIPYINTYKIFSDINKNLQSLVGLSTDQSLIYDDIIAQSGFNTDMYSKYSDVISKLDSVDAYISKSTGVSDSFTDKSDVMMMLYNDLIHFIPNVQQIANLIASTYALIQSTVKTLDENTNGVYQSQERTNELLSFLDGFDKTFRDIVLSVSKNLISRLNNISTIVEDINAALPIIPMDQSEFVLSEGVDYVNTIMESIFADMENAKESMFTEMHKEYVYLRNMRDRGVKTVFEAGKEQASAKLKEKVSGGFSSIIDKITTIFDKKVEEKVAKNNQWLSQNKGKLTSLDTNEIQFRVVPYENVTEKTILAYISTVSSNVKGLNQARFDTFATKDDLLKYLFPFVPESIGDVTELNGKFKLVLTVGKTGNTEAVEFTGGSAATQITKMIKYCESYGGYSKQVLAAIEDLKKATQEKVTELSNKNKSVNESVILDSEEILILEAEVDEATDKSPMRIKKKVPVKKSEGVSPTELSSSVKLFIGSVLNGIRDKYFDYIKVLGEEL